MPKKNYNKTHFIKFRVTEEEYQQMQMSLESRGITSVSEYCRICIRDPKAFYEQRQMAQFKEILFLLRKADNRIEQLQRNIGWNDENHSAYDKEILNVLSEIRRTTSRTKEIMEEIVSPKKREETT